MTPNSETTASKWCTTGMRGAAWVRLGFSLLILGGSGWAFVGSMQAIHHGCMDAFGGFMGIWLMAVPLLGLGILSIVFAIPLFRNSLWGVKAALIFDAFIGGMGVIGVVASSTLFFLEGHFGEGDLPVRLGTTASAAGVVLLMAAEAAWLLSVCRGWRTAWRCYTAFAAVMVAMVAWLPLAEYQGLRHVRVLKNYVTEHLITMPANSRFHVWRESFGDGRHGHRVDFPGQEYGWAFFVKHDDGGWRFQDMGGMLFRFGMSPQLRSAAEARDLLLHCGVPAGNLGTNLEVKLPMAEKFVIDAPAIGGRYGVDTNGCVRLYFVAPLVLSDAPPKRHKAGTP